MFFLSGCTPTTTRPDTSRTSTTIVSCSGKLDCPLSEEKKKELVAALRESGDPEALRIADGIESGEIKLYELNDAVFKKYPSLPENADGAHYNGKVYIRTNMGPEKTAAVVGHEGTHFYDLRPSFTDAQKLARELKAFETQARTWKALKQKRFFLVDFPNNDHWLNHYENGTLRQDIIHIYKLNP